MSKPIKVDLNLGQKLVSGWPGQNDQLGKIWQDLIFGTDFLRGQE
jgi:hypothetical protein